VDQIYLGSQTPWRGVVEQTNISKQENITPTLPHMEKRIQSIWAHVLNLPHVALDQSFLAIGGDSYVTSMYELHVRHTLTSNKYLCDASSRPMPAGRHWYVTFGYEVGELLLRNSLTLSVYIRTDSVS
jgi:hypothetical protein